MICMGECWGAAVSSTRRLSQIAETGKRGATKNVGAIFDQLRSTILEFRTFCVSTAVQQYMKLYPVVVDDHRQTCVRSFCRSPHRTSVGSINAQPVRQCATV